ncbi:MAG: FecR domain-containing protein [Sphingomonas sp.]
MGDEGKAGAELSDQAIEWLVALDCGTADEQAFNAWRDADPRHAAAFAQAAATWRRTADPRLSVLLDQPGQAGSPEPEIEPAMPGTVSRRAVAAGAVAVLGVGGAGAFMAWPRRAFAATGIGQRRTVRLPDGSQAMLNTDTSVSWRFENGREFWIERGEAALLVREAEAPFRVYSDPIDARLSGGKFNIRLAPDGGRLLVLAGRAAAAYRGTLAETIRAGSALTVSDGAAGIAALSPDAIATATAWEHGKIRFNGMALDRAVAEFNRYLSDKIVLQQGDLAATRLGGEFQIDNPDGFLLALRDGFDIDHRRQGNQIQLFRRHG